MLRIGLVGAGLIAWAHGMGLQAMIGAGTIDASIDVVHDRRGTRAQRFAAAFGAEAVGTLSEVADRCDALWVCTPTAAHREAVDAAASAGRALFCEKPLATDVDSARALVDAVASAGVPAQSGLVL